MQIALVIDIFIYFIFYLNVIIQPLAKLTLIYCTFYTILQM